MSVLLPTEIVVHHSDTLDGPEVSWGAIRKWHVEHNGWRDIGYHAGCELVGDRYEILMGRAWNEEGAHVVGHNRLALGFCFVGDFTKTPPPPTQLTSGAKLLRYWMWLFSIPIERVYPHKALNPDLTECPGAAFPWPLLHELLA